MHEGRLSKMVEVAEAAGHHTLKYFRRQDLVVDAKSDDSPVSASALRRQNLALGNELGELRDELNALRFRSNLTLLILVAMVVAVVFQRRSEAPADASGDESEVGDSV